MEPRQLHRWGVGVMSPDKLLQGPRFLVIGTPAGSDWTQSEIDLVVADYFDMLALEYAGQPFVKSERARSIQALTGRSKGSIEFKRQNISAVLDRLGIPWLRGYLPRVNFQGALLDAIESMLSVRDEITNIPVAAVETGLDEAPELFFDAPPSISQMDGVDSERMQALLRRFDPAARDLLNRSLGRQGELLVLQSEKSRIARINPDLASRVRWVSDLDGDGKGFDILSFDATGRQRFLEVKTTTGSELTPFYISSNELEFSQRNSEDYTLIRLHGFARTPRAFELYPPLTEKLLLKPDSYRAAFS